MKKLLFLVVLLALAAGMFFSQKHQVHPSAESAPPPENSELRDPQALLSLLARTGNDSHIVLPPGVYRFCDTELPGISVQGLRRTTIVADGVTVLFKAGQSFNLNDCEDVTLSGLTVDYDPLPFTQGTITAIDAAGKSVSFVLEDGYAALEDLPNAAALQAGRQLFFVFDPATAEPRPILNDSFKEITRIGGKAYTLSKPANGFLFDVLGQPGGAQVGDRIALFIRNGIAIGIHGSSRMCLDQVTVFTSPGYAFWEAEGGGGNRYTQCRIIRKPGTTRLITTVADGFHSYQVRKGPVIENCEFNDTVDDTIAIQGFFSLLLEAPSARTVYIVSPFGQDFSAGAEISFHEMPHGRPIGKAVVQSVEKIPDSVLAASANEVRQSFIKQHFNMRDLPVTQALKVELDRDINLPPGKLVLVSSSERCGNGAIVRNNTLRRGHVRGVIVKADDVLIEGNRFESIGADAVLVFPELFFLEGPMARKVTIRENTISHCGWKVLNARFANPGIGGAIQICTSMARRLFPPQLDPYPVICDVTIADNIVTDSGSYGIVLGNVLSGRVTNNRIEAPFNKPGGRESKGLDLAFDSQEHTLEKPASPRAIPAGILVYGSEDVVLSGNTVTPSVESGGVPPLILGPWCEHIDVVEQNNAPLQEN